MTHPTVRSFMSDDFSRYVALMNYLKETLPLDKQPAPELIVGPSPRFASVALNEHRMVGAAVITASYNPYGMYGTLDNVVRNPDDKYKGIGPDVVNHAITCAFARGAYAVKLICKDNPDPNEPHGQALRKFYKRFGFLAMDEVPEKERQIVMRLDRERWLKLQNEG